MTVPSRIYETLIKITILLILIAGMALYSSLQAQPRQQTGQSGLNDIDQSKAHKNIRLAEGLNPEAQAVQLQNFINSPYDDIKPRLTSSGDRLYFSRNFHPGNANGVNDSEDIWYSDYDADLNEWSEPMHMNGVLNNAGPNYVNNVSVSGDTIILGNQYLKKGKMRAGLSYSVNVNGVWNAPVVIDIESDYNLSPYANAYVSLKDGIIITSVQRVESLGGRDLFVSFWDGENATEPVNMGAVINTDLEESSPFLADDNKTLYFASKGHSGFGGFDIYVTRRLDDSWTNWSVPENLGPAVNGVLDEEFFSVTHCGKNAVFSKQVNVHNNDLYRISLETLFSEKPGKDDVAPMRKEAIPLASL